MLHPYCTPTAADPADISYKQLLAYEAQASVWLNALVLAVPHLAPPRCLLRAVELSARGCSSARVAQCQ